MSNPQILFMDMPILYFDEQFMATLKWMSFFVKYAEFAFSWFACMFCTLGL